jgi:hypothetical protein
MIASPQLPPPRSPSCFFSLSPRASVSAPPRSRQKAWEHMPHPDIHPTPVPTSTHAVAITHPRGHFTACAHHRFRRRRTSHSSSRPSPCSSSPTYCPRPRSQPRADIHSLTWVRMSRSCSWPFSVRAAEEDTVAPAMLRLYWR